MMRTVAIVLALAVVAFVGGRQVPRDSVAAPAPATTGQRPERRDMQASPGVVHPPTVVVAPRSEVAAAAAAALPPEWADLVRADPEAARAMRMHVIGVLQPRGGPEALAACLAGEPRSPSLEIRFAVGVETRDGDLHVGSPQFVEVIEGPVLSDRATACLERALAGDDVVDGGATVEFRGRADYRLTIHRPS